MTENANTPFTLTAPDISEQLAALEAAAAEGNEAGFVEVCRTIDWSAQPPDVYAQAVRWALTAGAYRLAHQLANKGSERYPEHDELRRMTHVLAPPVVKGRTAPRAGIKENRDWLQNHWQAYQGKWVALRSGQLVGAADSLEALVEQVGDVRGTGILVTRV